jgi:L-fucose mutarotase
MLHGIDPLLTGELLAHLDAMGHSDGVVVADAHFPARRVGTRVLDLPGHSAPRVVAAVCSVLPLDEDGPLGLMDSGEILPVQTELIAAAGQSLGTTEMIERFAFYEVAAQAFLVVRTGEVRPYGNALLRKGLVS